MTMRIILVRRGVVLDVQSGDNTQHLLLSHPSDDASVCGFAAALHMDLYE